MEGAEAEAVDNRRNTVASDTRPEAEVLPGTRRLRDQFLLPVLRFQRRRRLPDTRKRTACNKPIENKQLMIYVSRRV